ncbi:alpha-2B adrenergic receptor-like [Asterias rubens]|uniref:alpha-2B adrenergic receptor-like n=1 Tax=Asterias rubens TaxID=7604 RepID=UPI0014555718|nr:alpha-2B adrenergic receptor-like [Asterias rubens]
MDATIPLICSFHILVFLIGVPGNLLILQVFVKKTRKTSTNVFIMALASVDLMACLLRPVFVGNNMVLVVTGEYPSIWSEIIYYVLTYTTIYSSTILTAAIAFDRYDAVCRPHTRLLTYFGAQVVAVCCCVVSLPMTVPTVLMYFRPTLAVRLSRHCLSLSTYIISLLLVIIFYICVYKAVLYRTKVRTKWGRFTGVTAAVENSVSVAGQTEVSTLAAATRDISKLSPVTEQCALQDVNHGQSDTQFDSKPNQTSSPTDLEIVSLKDNKQSVVYRNLGTNEGPSNAQNPPSYSSLSPEIQETSSSAVSENLKVPISPQISGCGTSTSATNSSTKRQRSPSERVKSSKSIAVRMQNKTTRMLLITTIVFFVTWIPYMCLASISIYHMVAQVEPNKTLMSFFSTASHLLLINNAGNPFIYVLANRQFRNDCQREVRRLARIIQPCCRCFMCSPLVNMIRRCGNTTV